MKKTFIIFEALLLLLSCVSCAGITPETETLPPFESAGPAGKTEEETIIKRNGALKDVKAVWLSQYDMLNVHLQNGKQRDEASFRLLAADVMKNIASCGLNTVFMQIRPFGDSFYPSEFFPSSAMVTGKTGDPFAYDPLPILINEAHGNGLSIHAWINPYRCMTVDEIKNVDEKYAVRRWYDDPEKNGREVFTYNGRIYLSPAYDEPRALILNGVNEILDAYDFDGIHIDDYFYPTTDLSADQAAYDSYAKDFGEVGRATFRYVCVNKLVRSLYLTVKQKDKNLLFGVSPAGIIKNAYGMDFADVYTWGKEKGYVDYLAPQLYFGLEHETAPFDRLMREWSDLTVNPEVGIIYGMTLTKAYSGTDPHAGSGQNEWSEHKDILIRCLDLTKEVENCCGVALFSYQHLFVPGTDNVPEQTKEELSTFLPGLKEIKWKYNNEQ